MNVLDLIGSRSEVYSIPSDATVHDAASSDLRMGQKVTTAM